MKNYLLIILLTLLSNIAYCDAVFDSQLKLAAQGHASAQFNLGFMYDSGEGVPENDKTAVMWYKKSCRAG